jgi:hypothetical protein
MFHVQTVPGLICEQCFYLTDEECPLIHPLRFRCSLDEALNDPEQHDWAKQRLADKIRKHNKRPTIAENKKGRNGKPRERRKKNPELTVPAADPSQKPRTRLLTRIIGDRKVG